MPSPWIALRDACDLARHSDVGEQKILNGLQDGELLARASDLSEYALSKVECSLLRPIPQRIIMNVVVEGKIHKISILADIEPLDPGEHQKEIGGDVYTIVRHDDTADIWCEGKKVSGPSQADLDPHFWSLAHTNTAFSWAIADDLYNCTRRKASGILLARSDLARISPHFSAGSRSSKNEAVGRPTGTDWEKVALEIVRIYRQDRASIKSQADLVRRVQNFISENPEMGGKYFAESTLKKHIGPFHELLWLKI
jgi:hypothetical protein